MVRKQKSKMNNAGWLPCIVFYVMILVWADAAMNVPVNKQARNSVYER